MAIGPLINGRRYSYSSLEIQAKMGPGPLTVLLDVSSIGYGENVTWSFVNGTLPIPIGTTAGVWEGQEGTMRLGESTLTSLVTQVGPGWMQINFLLTVNYFDIGEVLTTDVLLCRLKSHTHQHDYGPDPLGVDLVIQPIAPIIRNGVIGMANRVV